MIVHYTADFKGRHRGLPLPFTVHRSLSTVGYFQEKNIEIRLTPDEKEDLDWAKKVFKTIDEKGKKLSSWEINFIANLNGQIQSGYPLTEAQLDKLAEIFHERCR